MSEYIKLGFTIALAVFIFFGVFWGLIRGFRKTVSRGLFLLATAILLVFITAPITYAILKTSINTNITIWNTQLAGKMSLLDAIAKLMEGLIGIDFATKYPLVVEIITSIPVLFINSIVYLILFWFTKIILYPLNYLVYRLVFKPKTPKVAQGFSAFGEGDNNPTPFSEEPKTIEENQTQNMNTIPVDNAPKPSETINAEILEPTIALKETESDVGKFIVKTPEAEENDNTKKVVIDTSKPRENKVKEKKVKEKKPKKERVSKHRLLGGLIGALVGLVVTFNTMVPFYGLFSILESANKVELENMGDSNISLNKLTNNLSSQLLEGYEQSAMNLVSTYSGLEALGLATFDYVSTKTIDGNKISLRFDVDNLIATANDVDTLLGLWKSYQQDGQLKQLNQSELDTLVSSVKQVLLDAKEVKLIDCLDDYIIPVASDYLITKDIKITNNDKVNNLIKDVFTTLNTAEDINLFDELNAIMNVVEYVNSEKLLLPIINNQFDDVYSIIALVKTDFGEKLTNKLFQSKLVNVTMPNILNIAFTYVDDSIHFGYVDNNATSEQIKSSLINLTTDLISVAKTFEGDMYITENSLIPLGKLINTIVNSSFVSEETFDGLIQYGVNQLKTLSTDIIPAEFKDSFNNKILNNVSEVDDWESDFTKIADALTILRDKEKGCFGKIEEGHDLRVGTDFDFELNEKVLENIGLALDKLESSTLLGNTQIEHITGDSNSYDVTPITSILSAFIDMAKDTIKTDYSDDDTLQSSLEILDIIKNNLITANHKYSSGITFWKTELKNIAPLVVTFGEIIETDDIKLNTKLGQSLDQARTGVLLSGDTTLKIFDIALEAVTDSILGADFDYATASETDKELSDLLDSIQTNLGNDELKTKLNADPTFWEKEIVAFIALQEISDSVSEISTIEDAMDLTAKLDQVYLSSIIPLDSFNSTIAEVIRETKTLDTTGVKGEINNIIESIATKLEDSYFLDGKDMTNFWSIELDYIQELNDLDTTGLLDSEAKAREIGQLLDNLTHGYDKVVVGEPTRHIRGSYFIEHNQLRQLLSAAIDELTTDIIDGFDNLTIKNSISTAITSIKSNMNNTSDIPDMSFAEEFVNIQILANLNLDTNIFSSSSSSLTSLGHTLDSIAFNTKTPTTYDDTTYTPSTPKEIDYRGTNSLLITRQIINTLLYSIVDVAKTSTPTDAINGTIDSIKAEINTLVTNPDTLVSWQRELGFVSSLMNLKDHTNLNSISNIVYLEIGATLDSIAFNKKTSNELEFDESKNSIIITRNNLNTTMANLITTAKVTGNATLNDTIDSMADNITANADKIYSWERELGFVYNLTTLKDVSEINDTNYINVGNILDGIAFNKVKNGNIYTYDDDKFTGNTLTYKGTNSLLITREMLNTNIANIIGDTSTTSDIINNTLTNISNSIITNSAMIYSWAHELTKVKDLIDLKNTIVNSDALDQPYSVSHPLIILANSLDAISFNYTGTSYNQVTYIPANNSIEYAGNLSDCNSVIITREILTTMVAGFMADAKVTESPTATDNIINEIIDNATTTINTGNTIISDKYSNFHDAFKDLLGVKAQVISTLDTDFPTSILAIDTTFGNRIDLALSNLQDIKVCGIITTAKIAKEIVNKIHNNTTIMTALNDSHYAISKAYLEGMYGYYNGTISTHQPYNESGAAVNYPNPFTTLAEKIITDTNNLI